MPTPTLRHWLGIELVEVSPLEKAVAALGGGLSILILVLASSWVLPGEGAACVIASMGASAVLLFGVPHGSLSQPWPVIAGHVISAVIGVACARCLPQTPLAAACAVGLSIAAMQQLRCIHPPGGATAFTAVMGGQAVHELGYQFVLVPVLANALLMVLLAVMINFAFRWRRYPVVLSRPRVPSPPASASASVTHTHAEVVAALRTLDSFVDISEGDLLRLVDLISRSEGPDSRTR
jgi:CBS-domain-containing membrane protein